ncbi:hypothetical protein, partial [Paenibacillus xylanexedens]|uniref:hypothetical protein n=1 Tax=Paenibacillus xylanexedens TaxID=528191 RepID=UPI0034D96060
MPPRHPNKRRLPPILPQQHIPFFPHPTPLQILLNPLPLPSPINIAQVLQLHFPIPPIQLPIHLPTPLFDEANDYHVFH